MAVDIKQVSRGIYEEVLKKGNLEYWTRCPTLRSRGTIR
jgi:hypothetical protein